MGDCFSSTSPSKFPTLLENAKNTPRGTSSTQFFAIYDTYTYTYISLHVKYLVRQDLDLQEHLGRLSGLGIQTASQLDTTLMQVVIAIITQNRQVLTQGDGAEVIAHVQGDIFRMIQASFEQNYGCSIVEFSIPAYLTQVPPYGPKLATYTLEQCWVNNGSILRVIQKRSLWEVYADLMQGRNTYGVTTWGKPCEFLAIAMQRPAADAIYNDFRVDLGIPLGNSIMRRIVKESPLRIIDSLVDQCRNGNIGFPTPDGGMMLIPEHVPVVNPFRVQGAGTPSMQNVYQNAV